MLVSKIDYQDLMISRQSHRSNLNIDSAIKTNQITSAKQLLCDSQSKKTNRSTSSKNVNYDPELGEALEKGLSIDE